jgi:hypothetical protein
MNPLPWRKTVANSVAIITSLVLLATARAGDPAGPSSATNELVSFASRVKQGAVGTFDINMPLSGALGIEDRVANTYVGVAAYAEDIDPACECYYELNGERTDVDLIDGLLAFFNFSTLTAFQVNLVTVNCGGVETVVPFALAYADVDASGVVSHNDKLQVKFNIGMPLTADDFRADVNADGKIDQQDGLVVRAYKGQSLPP